MVKMPFDELKMEIDPLSVPRHKSRLLGIKIPALAFPIFSEGYKSFQILIYLKLTN
jgi:hypothetical protein